MEEHKSASPEAAHSRHYDHISDDTRAYIYRLRFHTSPSTSYSCISALTAVKQRTVARLCRRYKQTGQIKKKHKGGNHKQVLSAALRARVVELQSGDHAATLADIQHSVERDEEFISKRKGSKKKKTPPHGVNRNVFRSFILNLFSLPLFNSSSSSAAAASSAPLRQFVFLMDNAQIHKGDIDEVIFSSGHEIIYMPPWSPPLNPIEYVFSKWKFSYRCMPHDTDTEVNSAIAEAAKSITPEHCLHYFQHTQSLYPDCIALKDM